MRTNLFSDITRSMITKDVKELQRNLFFMLRFLVRFKMIINNIGSMGLIASLMMYAVLPIVTAETEQCYSDNSSPYVYFSDETSYVASRGSKMNIPKECDPIYVWGLIRHGTRYPEKTRISAMKKFHSIRDEIIQNHNNGRGHLCDKDLRNLEGWNFTLSENMSMELTDQGIKDLILVAREIKEAFPKLLKTSSKGYFTFQSSQRNRTKDSAMTFSNELLGTNFTNTSGNNITQDDEFLYLNMHCPRFKKEVRQNHSMYNEVKAFETSAMMQKVIAEISIRLGYLQPLPFENITLMYHICAYENAWYVNSRPPFCAAFSTEDLKTLDYLYDMTEYYSVGYGNSFTEKMGSILVQDMMISLSNAAKNNSQGQKGKFLFSHEETIVPTTVKLGLHKDEEPLRNDNYEKMINQRKFRLSLFSSFSANIITSLMKCPSQNGFRNVVLIHQNERPVVIPKCVAEFCTLEEMQEIFKDVFNKSQCNTEFCKLPDNQSPSSASSLIFNFHVFFISYIFICYVS